MKISHSEYVSIKEMTIQGRYVINEQIVEFLKNTELKFRVRTIGKSVEDRPIKSVVMGTGPIKVMMWSQMHGNESTTTKAVLDLINFLDSGLNLSETILKCCTIAMIPMLNPDGAAVYTRVNANEVDLNRDAQQRTQPESIVLRTVFDEFRPDYCFNLHDQRTIFNVGSTSKPATVSFLAPAHDEERTISKTRSMSMKLIVAMNTVLQQMIPGQIGRYDDGFNANCVGDTFQMLNTPTLLFEAGHYPNDYKREQTREYIFYALIAALTSISENEVENYVQEKYFDIPENQKRFFDILIMNANLVNPSLEKGSAIGLLFKEIFKDNTVRFIPKIEKTGNLQQYYGHKLYNCSVASDFERLKQQVFYELIKSKI